jgi:hypothetical protein
MDMTSSGVAPPARSAPRGPMPASFVLGGALLSLIGLSWDIQWHNDVGPDTFFTMPHLFLYSGSAVAGFASLAVVLSTTATQRRGNPIDPTVGGRAVGVFRGTFAAPVGYLLSGVGAALFLIYGLWDEWWHQLYGFDVMIASPPHIGFLLSVQITMVGAMVIFTAAREHRWGAIGAIVSTATLLMFSIVTVEGLDALEIGDLVAGVAGVFMCVLLMMMCARALGRPVVAVGVAVVVAVIQAFLWWFDPWATAVYADAIALPMRDYIDGVPNHPAMIPMVLIVVGGLIAIPHGLPAWLVGAISGTVIGVVVPLQQAWLYDDDLPGLPTVLIFAAASKFLGALAGMLATRFGEMLRQFAPTKETNHA